MITIQTAKLKGKKANIFFRIGILFLCIYGLAYGEEIEPVRYRLEHVAGVWQKGYLDGPAKGAMFSWKNITIDDAGNIFVADETRVRVIDIQERVWTVAGNGIRGFRDGPADMAMFNTGGRGYYKHNIALDKAGNIYLPDGNNNRIRKIFKNSDDRWWVETFAGGGNKKIKPGQTLHALDIQLGGPVSLAVDSLGNVWTEDYSCIYKITPTGKASCYKNVAGEVANMQADGIGNVYLLVRENWAARYWKVSQDGKMEKIAGLEEREIDRRKKSGERINIDGPALEATFWANIDFAVSPDGKVIYGGNGDEHVVRRIKDGVVMSLFKEGWSIEEKNRGNGWHLGGPISLDKQGRIYLYGNNPPDFLWFRRLVPEE